MVEVWQFLVKGGIIMIPLALCSILALAVVIEKAFSLRRKKVIVPEIVNVLDNIKGPDDVGLAMSICEKHEGPFANVIRTGLEYRNQPKDEIKEALTDQGRQEVRNLERGLVILETVAGIAPLLGLLGTVIGILKVFNVISKLGVGQAAALSGGISEALITTIVGLSIGIPAVVVYNFFTDKAEDLVLEIEKHSSTLLKKVTSFQFSDRDRVAVDAVSS
ncbi:MotA/TolQ/ExbB proton channel family protein [candidate division KSB1 bacterium]|nr:MotA/TolQ/ExbB proton channel family protein [candidate division KSB1 bacterium]NIR71824.1 MotA/TolQ/ExbB proton channel family protein [candidate division KSB1 bacterium]NIS25340.1 MotA/TolQ/ExbB proton channel family protein [candidate division KSB1 bacterium]NIT71810.1 MotA/TolQ/ExbB proton channel family protein [candidate division KSB1 bacterium]NIU25548.1 MotA/TolQ/ExbB proton channel family protein [candidate division KSB1 bacterium]